MWNNRTLFCVNSKFHLKISNTVISMVYVINIIMNHLNVFQCLKYANKELRHDPCAETVTDIPWTWLFQPVNGMRIYTTRISPFKSENTGYLSECLIQGAILIWTAMMNLDLNNAESECLYYCSIVVICADLKKGSISSVILIRGRNRFDLDLGHAVVAGR